MRAAKGSPHGAPATLAGPPGEEAEGTADIYLAFTPQKRCAGEPAGEIEIDRVGDCRGAGGRRTAGPATHRQHDGVADDVAYHVAYHVASQETIRQH